MKLCNMCGDYVDAINVALLCFFSALCVTALLVT